MNITERKVNYDGTIVEYTCRLVRLQSGEAIVFYEIPNDFRMNAGERSIYLHKGTITLAYFWENRPYNVYHWRSADGTYIGTYVNIVKDTRIEEDEISYVDMIIDVLIFPDGEFVLLDEDELPQPLPQFEEGTVYRSLQQLKDEIDTLIPYLIRETDQLIADGKVPKIKKPAD